MKQNLYVAALAFTVLLSACHKNDPEADADPCAGITIDSTALSARWTQPFNPDGATWNDNFPVFAWQQQAVYVPGPLGQQTVIGRDAVSGAVLWQFPAVGDVFADYTYFHDGRLYYTDGDSLLVIDLASRSTTAVCNPPGQGYLVHRMAHHEHLWLFSHIGNVFGGSPDTGLYRLYLSDGTDCREVYRTTKGDWHTINGEALINQAVTITAPGDTVLMWNEIYTGPDGERSGFFLWYNLTRGDTSYTRLDDFEFTLPAEGMLIHEGLAIFRVANTLYAFHAATGQLAWKQPIIGIGAKVIRAPGVVLTLDNGKMSARRTSDGAAIWEKNKPNAGFVAEGSFQRDGLLYVLDRGARRLLGFDPATGCFHRDQAIPAPAAEPDFSPRRMTVSTDGQTVYLGSSRHIHALGL